MRACRGPFALDANRRDASPAPIRRICAEVCLQAQKSRFASGFERIPARSIAHSSLWTPEMPLARCQIAFSCAGHSEAADRSG